MRRFLYLLKKIIIWAILGAMGWQAFHYMHETDQERTLARAYLPTITGVNGAQVRELILSGNRNNRPTLLYVFDSSGILSRWNYNDIQYFAQKYPRTQVNILMLSVDEDPLDLAAMIYKKKGTRVPILLLSPPGKASLDNLYAELYRLGAKDFELGSYPYIAVINKAGYIQQVQFGFDRKNKITGLLDRALQQGKGKGD